MPRPLTAPLSLLLLLATGLAGACARPAGVETSTPRLRRALQDAPRLEVYLPPPSAAEDARAGDEALTASVHAAARVLASRSGKEVAVLAAGEAGDPAAPRLVLGRPGDEAVREVIGRWGGVVEARGWVYHRQHVQAEGDLLIACGPDPERPGLPLGLLVATDPAQLRDVVEDLTPAARPGVRAFCGRRPVVEFPTGAAEHEGRTATSLARTAPTAIRVRRSRGFDLRRLAGVSPERAEAYAERTERAVAAVARWAGDEGLDSTDVLAVDSTAAQRELAGAVGLSVSAGAYHSRVTLLAPGTPDDAGASVARDAARAAVGAPAASWLLDGAALDAAGEWWGRDLARWGARLARRELLPSVEECVADASIDRLSRHRLAPARGLLFRFLREERGAEAVRALWRGEAGLDSGGDLDARFRAWVLAATPDEPTAEAVHRVRLERLAAVGFQRGVALDSNARSGGGYDHGGLAESLEWAVLSGANSLSVTSYLVELPGEPEHAGGFLPDGLGSLEGDAAIAQVAAAADSAGIEVKLLVPHLLLGRSGGLSGWLRRTSVGHWEEFFATYPEMLVHYGLLAELCGFDVLCAGVELLGASGTAQLPAEAQRYHAEETAESLATARRAFDGALTYAAGSPGELACFPALDALDLLGVSFFPSLGEFDSLPPPDAELRRGLAARLAGFAAVAAERGQPLLLVETGFRSTSRAVTDATIGPGPAEPAEQARGLRALRQALEDRIARGCDVRGAYLWRWDADPDAGGAADRGYTLVGKPAAAELRLFGGGR